MSWHHKYERVPFLEKGRTIDGCDCWGLVALVLKNERGIDLPDYLMVYDEDFKSWSSEQRQQLQKVISEESAKCWQEVEKPQAFDVILMKMKGFNTHVGIAIDGNRMIHCQRNIGTSIEKMDSIRWRNNVVGFYRWAS